VKREAMRWLGELRAKIKEKEEGEWGSKRV